jgi:uncharacterized protein YjbI with pentapeptide repeats
MTQCNFQGSDLTNCDFGGAQGAQSVFCETKGEGVNFAGAGLRQSLFTKSALPGARFDRADLYQCHFADAVLTAASFRGAELTYADFSRATLERVDAREATMYRTVLHRAETTGAQFDDRLRALETDPKLAQAETWQPETRR